MTPYAGLKMESFRGTKEEDGGVESLKNLADGKDLENLSFLLWRKDVSLNTLSSVLKLQIAKWLLANFFKVDCFE